MTLDEVERTLNENDLMIANVQVPMCIAGVFGGLNSGVKETTKSIFLESAYFNPTNVRKTARTSVFSYVSETFSQLCVYNTCKKTSVLKQMLITFFFIYILFRLQDLL